MLTASIIKGLLDEVMELWDDEENQTLVKERLLEPMVGYITDKLYPYVMISIVVILILLLLLGMILFLILTKQKAVTT